MSNSIKSKIFPAPLAQLVEQRPLKPSAAGSSPARGTKVKINKKIKKIMLKKYACR